MVDEDGYYWIEEYPTNPPTHVLNGLNIGLWGVYDYWLLMETEAAERVLQASLMTLEDKMDAYRRPGRRSLYCLDPPQEASNTYHRLHVHQFEQLEKISGKSSFGEIADLLRQDHPVEDF